MYIFKDEPCDNEWIIPYSCSVISKILLINTLKVTFKKKLSIPDRSNSLEIKLTDKKGEV
jgi:hypothetical protein